MSMEILNEAGLPALDGEKVATVILENGGHAARAHARISASGMHTSLHCPGSIGLSEQVPQARSKESDEGTLAHEWSERLAFHFLKYQQTGIADSPYCSRAVTPILENGLTAEIWDAANMWRDLLWKNCFEQTITDKAYELESKLTFSVKYDIWGTTDFWLVSKDARAKRYGFIADFKFGRVDVDVEKNPQLACYAVALRQELRNLGKDLDYVRTAIYQPRAGGWKEAKCPITTKQLDAWEKKFNELAVKVYSGKQKYVVGEYCRYCKGQVLCPVYGKQLSKETQIALVSSANFEFPAVEGLPQDVRARITLNEKPLKAFVAACRTSVLADLARGPIPGIKAVSTKPKRKLNSLDAPAIQAAVDQICLEQKRPPVQTWEPKLMGIGKLEKALGKNKVVLTPFMGQTNTSIKIVPEDAPGEAITSATALLPVLSDEDEEDDE